MLAQSGVSISFGRRLQQVGDGGYFVAFQVALDLDLVHRATLPGGVRSPRRSGSPAGRRGSGSTSQCHKSYRGPRTGAKVGM